MKKQKVIGIFGGGGFVGRAIVRRLAKQGHLIKVGSRYPDSHTVLKTYGSVGQVQLVRADIRCERSIQEFIHGCDVVINLVGILFEKGKQTFGALHLGGAEHIAKACAKQKISQLIHISALGVSEKSTSYYSRTKALAEKSVKKAFKDVVILQPSLIYGPDDQFFNRFARMAKVSPILPVFKGGETKFQPLYVDDLARGVEVIIQKNIIGESYALAGPSVYTFKELLEFTLETVGKDCMILSLPHIAGYALSLVSKLLPTPLLTLDQLKLLDIDSILSKEAKTFADLGISPSRIEDIVPTYITREV